MFQFKSILSRIILLHVVAIAATAILMPLVLLWFLNSEVENLQHQTLKEQVDALSRGLISHEDGTWSLELSKGIQDQYSNAYGRYRYAILSDDGNVLFSSDGSAAVFPADNRSSKLEYLETQNDKSVISGVSTEKQLGDRTFWIQVGEDLAHRDVIVDDIVARFFSNVGWITMPILLLLLAIDILIFRRAVRPLLVASERAQDISPTRIDIRLPTDAIPQEIVPLVIAVNQALDRLECGFRRQREFAADVAHELRTPLAILRTRIETSPERERLHALHQDIERMTRVVTQLLEEAELETVIVDSNETADLREVCAEVVEFVTPLALKEDKAVALLGVEHPVWIKSRADILGRAIRNLVENALNHTPRGTEVEVVVQSEGVVSVSDRGEGIRDDERDLIFKRFWRRNRQHAGSAGLGLSIVKNIVSMYNGTIEASNNSDGGARFIVRFKLAVSPTQ